MLFFQRREADHHGDAEAEQGGHALAADPEGERKRGQHVRPLEPGRVDAIAHQQGAGRESGLSFGGRRHVIHADKLRRPAPPSQSLQAKRAASPPEGPTISPSHITRRPRMIVPTGQPVTRLPS